jgi:hypothetical protein
MPESRDWAQASTDWSTAYQHYLLRAAAQSARTLHLYEQVIGCVARRQLSPAVLREGLTEFLRDHGGQAAARTAALSARFFAGLASAAFLAMDDAGDEIPLPEVDPSDLARSFERLGAYSMRANERALRWYGSQLATLAAGEMAPAQFRKAMAAAYGRVAAARLTRVAHLWFELLAGLEEIRTPFLDSYLLAALRKANPIGFDADSDFIVDLRAPLGATTSAEVRLENTRAEPAIIRCAVSEVRRADGVGRAFAPRIAIAPAELRLDRDGQSGVRLSLLLDENVFEADAPYVGLFHIFRDAEPSLDVPLRITATAKERP